MPLVKLRVEQSRFGSFFGEPSDSNSLVPITSGARKTEVVEFSLAAKRQWLNVFDFKGDNRERFARFAIGTALLEVGSNASPELSGDIDAQSKS